MSEAKVYSADVPNTLVWDSNLELFTLAYNPDNTATAARRHTLDAIKYMRAERQRIGDCYRLGITPTKSVVDTVTD